MNLPSPVRIDVRKLVFPLVVGRNEQAGFLRSGFAGTGFFVGRNGLMLTAAHVALGAAEGFELRAALPSQEGPMIGHPLRWAVSLPQSDIAVCQVDVPQSACFATRFDALSMGTDVETVAVPESMLETDRAGRTKVSLRTSKGYISFGTTEWVAASFSLPKGMSGAPLIATEGQSQYVVGVFVGQTRGEEIEDMVEEIVEEGPDLRRVRTERISKVEYFARGELLTAHMEFRADEFNGLTLQQLIESAVGHALLK
jgi:hypothetical protein